MRVGRLLGASAIGLAVSTLAAPSVSEAVSPVPAPTAGYWLVGGDGGVFSFNAPFYGSGLASAPDRERVGPIHRLPTRVWELPPCLTVPATGC